MKIIESLMLTSLLFVCIYSSITDIAHGIIENKLIKIFLVVSVILDVAYYCFLYKEKTNAFLINLALVAIISLIMYKLNLWAAGDSKLIITISMLYPARIYGQGIVPLINIIVFSFSLSFIYISLETIYLYIKNKEKISIDTNILFENVKRFVVCFIYILFFNYVISYFFEIKSFNDVTIFSFVNLFISIYIYKNEFLFKKMSVIISFVLFFLLVISSFIFKNTIYLNFKVLVLSLIFILIQILAEKYNYRKIYVKDLKKGMILSLSSIAQFDISKTRGLPRSTTEDMRSRLTSEQVESVKRWSKSKYGNDMVIIVRKIPYAIFISAATFLYLFMNI